MLHQAEAKILSVLSGRMAAEDIASQAGIPLSSVLSFAQGLKEKSYVALEYVEERKVSLSPSAKQYLPDGLPEQAVHRAAKRAAAVSSLSPGEKSIGLAWATKNGWVRVENGVLRAIAEPPVPYPLQAALSRIAEGTPVDPDALAVLLKRKLAVETVSKKLFIEPTAVQPEAATASTVNLLTRDMLLTGSYKNLDFRGYDVSAPAEIPPAAKRHMISRLRRRIGRIFTDMGFEEMSGSEIQASFWNFDALFQPQDHPARDLADTFYLRQSLPLPKDKGLVSRVKKVQEKCWGGAWTEEKAAKSVLRTHTTAVSASYLYNNCKDRQPKKYFSIGKVYRNEATDYKHLAEFFQVEGIVVWEGATFRDLLGCLREFYRKLGFERIRFQPSYFPYTEPSLEISVYFERKKQWIELGGAGIFRPEVSIPLCDRYPVLAWGLSLERPLMMLHDMDDIRAFYRNNIGWIRKQKVD